jgi:ribosomal protein L37AE/L43A
MTDRVYWEKKATKLYHACADCGSEVDKRRAKLGYHVCLTCGEGYAKEARLGWTIAPNAQIELRINHQLRRTQRN